ncbi:antitoxin family protein [Thermococcus sp.]
MPVEAVYEGGVIRPLKPLKLKDGQRVRVDVEEDFIEASFGIMKSKISLKNLEEAYHEYLLERAGAH